MYMTATIRTVEIGFGSTSAVINDQMEIITFKSIVHKIEEHKSDITSGTMDGGRNVTVSVGGAQFQVGPDIDKVYDPRNIRILNSEYINSEQYKVLFLGSLAMMELPENNTIDFLIGGLPVSNMHRRDELIAFMEGEHEVKGRKITVKKAWAAAQPLGGLMCYANDQGQDFLQKMKELTILTVDPGYLTLDHIITTGMFVSESRSGAVDKGMSKIIESVADQAAKVFGVDKVINEVIDKAFYLPEKAIKMKGRHYPFPICEGQDINGEDVKYNYNFTGAISRITKEACNAIQNSVGDAQDVDLILLVGGPANLYLQSLKEVYPDHRIIVVKNNLQAVCIGLHIAGLMKFNSLAKQVGA